MPPLLRLTHSAVFAGLMLLSYLAAIVQTADAQSSALAGFRALHKFQHTGTPSNLVRGGDGNFYGATNSLQIFRVTPAGAITIWPNPFGKALSPSTITLVRARNGEIYGLAASYGGAGDNAVFHLSFSGEVTIVHEFDAATEGTDANGLIAGSDGFLYGRFVSATAAQEDRFRGAIFRLSITGTLSIVHQFVEADNTGYLLGFVQLIQGTDGNLYLVNGGAGNGGLFRCTRTGVVTTVYSFSGGADGKQPSLLTQGTDGTFYVAHAPADGYSPNILSSITPAGVMTELHRFSGESVRTLIRGSNGAVYGISSYTTSSIFKFAPTTGFEVIYDFAASGGAIGSLLLSGDTLYGLGGDYVLQLPLSGSFSKLAQFNDDSGPLYPNGGFVQASDGTFYGTTRFGGATNNGTIYKLGPDGTFEVLYEFTGGSDGSSPVALVQGGDRALYGSTGWTAGSGTVLFRLSTAGVFTTLDTAQATSDGQYTSAPYFTLVAGADGVVYGVAGDGDRGKGYVFKLAPDGTPTKLYQFSGGADGARPNSLILATDRNLYGCTSGGGANGAGTLFRLTASGSLTVLTNFSRGESVFDSSPPHPGYSLVQASDGNLYYAISGDDRFRVHTPGGLAGIGLDGAAIPFRPATLDIGRLIAGHDGKLYGTSRLGFSADVFSCTVSGSLTKLYQFNGTTEGTAPQALLQGLDGNLYGTLEQDGIAGGGAIYQIPPTATGTLRNISTRANVLTGDNALFAGFIVSDTEPKQVVVRGLGPSLAAAAVPGTLADPTLRLFDAAGAEIAANDDWQSEPGVSATGLAPTQTREAAIVRMLAPGSYTATLRGKNNTTGVGLVEVYDVTGATPASRLANISSRGWIGSGDNVLIAGFIVADQGGGFGRVVARAIGPSLSASGTPDALQDPTLDLFDANGGHVASNDNWGSDQAQEINESGLAPKSESESALILSAPAGAYTAIVRGVGGTAGIGLVEIYALQ